MIVARDANVKHKPWSSEDQRSRWLLRKPVDHAILGDLQYVQTYGGDRPDIITLGFNQRFDEERLRQNLGAWTRCW